MMDPGEAPRVELTNQELEQDRLLEDLWLRQGAPSQGLALDLDTVEVLLACHPDPHLRAQVHDFGLMARMQQVWQRMDELAEVRRKVALYCGMSAASTWVCERSILRTSDNVVQFLQDVLSAVKPFADQYVDQLSAVVNDKESPFSLGPGQLDAAQAQLVRQEGLDGLSLGQAMEEYLSLDLMLEGLGQLLGSVLGLTWTRRSSGMEIWGKEVRVLDVQDRDRGYIGTLYIDPASSHCTRLVHTGCRGISPLVSSASQYAEQEDPSLSANHERGLKHNDQEGGQRPPLSSPSQGCMCAGGRTAGSNEVGEGSPDSSSGQSLFQGRDPHIPDVEGPGGTGGPPGSPAAVILGLEGDGMKNGFMLPQHVVLGVWGLLHELGHAIHFLLSAAALRSPGASPVPSDEREDKPELSGRSYTSCSPGAPSQSLGLPSGYQWQLHGSGAPLEVLEVPSSLFEHFAMHPRCLQVICRHSSTRQPLPLPLAQQLASHIRHTWYNPLTYQSKVLQLLHDHLLHSFSSKIGPGTSEQLWRHLWSRWSSAPEIMINSQQARALSHVQELSGGAYGYVVAGCVAQVIWNEVLEEVVEKLPLASAISEGTGISVDSHEEREGQLVPARGKKVKAAILELSATAFVTEILSNVGASRDVQDLLVDRELFKKLLWRYEGGNL